MGHNSKATQNEREGVVSTLSWQLLQKRGGERDSIVEWNERVEMGVRWFTELCFFSVDG